MTVQRRFRCRLPCYRNVPMDAVRPKNLAEKLLTVRQLLKKNALQSILEASSPTLPSTPWVNVRWRKGKVCPHILTVLVTNTGQESSPSQEQIHTTPEAYLGYDPPDREVEVIADV